MSTSTTARATTNHRELINTLDLPAKVRLLTGGNVFTLAPEPAIGLREVALSDGPTGVRGLKFTGGRTVALFPNATLLASAWSEDTAYEVGTLLAEEAWRNRSTSSSDRRSICTAPCSAAGSSRPTPRTPCSPGNSPPPTSAACSG